MESAKPEVMLVGGAAEMIQSSLTKNNEPIETITGDELTADAAYLADE